MLSIIILNYNNTYHTKKCLLSLQNQTFKNYEIILVDNESNGFYREQLYNFLNSNQLTEYLRKNIHLFVLKKNIGFTGGNNEGIKRSK